MFLSATTVSIYLLAISLAALVGRDVVKWLFTKDREIEARRKAAGLLAAHLKSMGLKRIPDFLIDYSVGDYIGMGEEIHDLTKLFLSSEKHVMEEFENVFKNVLDAELKTPDGRTLIAAKLADAAKAGDPSAVAAAPQVTVKV